MDETSRVREYERTWKELKSKPFLDAKQVSERLIEQANYVLRMCDHTYEMFEPLVATEEDKLKMREALRTIEGIPYVKEWCDGQLGSIKAEYKRLDAEVHDLTLKRDSKLEEYDEAKKELVKKMWLTGRREVELDLLKK